MALNAANSIGAITYRNSSIYKENKPNSMTGSAYAEKQQEHAKKISNMKRLIKGTDKNQNKPKSIVDQTLSYGESIRASRTKTKDTSTQMKKLKYNFKDISGQIRKSKTSVNAKQVASKARREVVQLKMKMQTEKYDNEELEAAITHAKAMERAAKKKARHLEEEELIKITDGESNGTVAVASELETKLEEKMEADYEANIKAEELEREAELEKMSEEQILETEQAIAESMEEAQKMMEESMEASMDEVTEDMYDLLAESMEDMMEQTLGELAESMLAVTDFEMTENEFTLFKLKHRASEDKAMLEADTKYLKAMFDIYDKRMNGGSGGVTGISGDVASAPISAVESPSIQNIVDISL